MRALLAFPRSTLFRALLLALLASVAACSSQSSTLDAARPDAALRDLSVDRGDRGDLGDGTRSDVASLDVGLDAADQGPPDLPQPDQPLVPFELRIMAANLTSGNAQSYTPGHGLRIISAFSPDVVLIQELNYGNDSPTDIAFMVQQNLGPTYSYYREVGQIPNGIISRYPIIDAGEWSDPEVSNRDFAWARIDLPGPRDLWAISVHLLTSTATARQKEAAALIAYLDQQVPVGQLIVLGGDFNTVDRLEAGIDTLRSRFTIAAPYPVDQAGNGSTNAGRTKPYDWVLASPSLHALEVPVVIGTASFPAGLVFDSRVYTPLSDVPPVLVDDSDAPSMQHMAVVRQFRFVP